MGRKVLQVSWLTMIIIALTFSGAWLYQKYNSHSFMGDHSGSLISQAPRQESGQLPIKETEETAVETPIEAEPSETNESGSTTVTSQIALTALSQVGYIPTEVNITKYHDDLGIAQGSDWCGYFVWWCLLQANREDLLIGGPGWAAHWTEEGAVHTPDDGYIPQAGDIVTFDRDGNGNVDHVGIVVGYDDGTLHTVEGNTVMQGTEEGETPYGVYARHYDSTGWMYVKESNDNT